MTRFAAIILSLIALATAAIAADKDKNKKEADAVAALMEATRPSLLTLYIHPKRLTGEQLEDVDPSTRSILSSYLRQEYPMRITAVVFNKKGWILTSDRMLDLRMIKKIEAEPIGGKRFEVKVIGILRRTPIMVLAAKDPKTATLTPVKFAASPKLDFATQLSGVSMSYSGNELLFGGSMAAKPFVIRRPAGTEAVVFRGLSGSSGITIIGDRKGRPIGVLPAGVAPESKQEDFLWIAGDVAKQKLYSTEQQVADRERLAELTLKYTMKVTVTFRVEGSGRGRYYSSSSDSEREQTLFGMAIDPTHLVVPTMLARKRAEKIERIEVEIDGKDVPCQLLGAIKTARAMILKLEKGTFPTAAQLADNQTIPWVAPLMNANFRKKYGTVDVQIFPDRCNGLTRAFGGVFRYRTIRHSRGQAAVLLDDRGRILGAHLVERPPHETIRQIRERGLSQYGGSRSGGEMVLFTGAELREMLTTDPKKLDQRIRAMTKDRQYRRPWLGVEVSAMNKELAESMDIRKPTRDGQLGLVVGVIYPSSPAAKLGLKQTDMLLKITPAEKPDLEIELKSSFAQISGGGEYVSDIDFSKIDRSTYIRPNWKPRNSFFPRLLDEIGIGEKIEVTWLSGSKLITRPLTIEMAPRDMRSAKKATDEKTGLTVKELTYEVRQGYKLASDAPGVLVVKAKGGSPAALAKLGVFSIIAKVNETPITSPEQFTKLLTAARKASKKSVKLFIQTPGSSRFADLNLK